MATAKKKAAASKKQILTDIIIAAILVAILLTVLFSTVFRVFRETDKVTRFVAIEVKNHGTIIVKLDPKTAPITVENFQNLVAESFYDG